MLKIDIHTHILPPDIPLFKEKFGYGGFIQLKHQPGCDCADMLDDSGNFFRRVDDNCYNPHARLKDMATQDVHVQVLSTVPVMFSYWAKPKDGLEVCQFLNDHIVKVVNESPKKFIGLGSVPLQDPQLSVQEVERGMKLGLRGFQIGSNVNQINLSDPQFFPFFEACEKAGAALFVHPWEMMGEKLMTKYWLPWLVGMPAETSRAICSMIFGGVFEKFPALRVAFAHGGGSFPFTWPRIQHGFDVRPDLCARDNKTAPKKYLGHFFVDSLVHDPELLRYLVKTLGAERVCLGTDYPFPLGELAVGEAIRQAGFDLETQEKIYHRTALHWLGLKKESFI